MIAQRRLGRMLAVRGRRARPPNMTASRTAQHYPAAVQEGMVENGQGTAGYEASGAHSTNGAVGVRCQCG